MVGRLIILLFCISFSYASKIEVQALNFYADENSGKNILSGNVIVTRDKDILKTGELIIYTNKNHKPIRYEATQSPQFEITLKDKLYKGSGDKLSYDVTKDIYEIDGNAFINEVQTNKKLHGDKIIVDKKQNIYRVESKNNKPARFVFELENKQ